MPPLAVSVCEYAVATVPLGSVAGLMVTGTSSLLIVPTPVPSAMVELVAPNKPTLKASFASGTMSPLTTTVAVFVIWPGVKLSVPDAAV